MLQVKPSQTIELLRLTLQDELDKSSADAVIKLCIDRTKQILRWSRGPYWYHIQQIGLTNDDLAYDIVAELVTESEGRYCVLLRRSLAKMPHDVDDELLSSFDALLFKNVSQSLTDLLSEINRSQYLLLRSLRSSIRTRPDIAYMDGFDGRWYMFHDPGLARIERSPMPIEILRLYARGAEMDGSPFALGLLLEMLNTLDAQDEFRKTVREGDVIQIALEIISMRVVDVRELEYMIDGDTDVDDRQRAEREIAHALDEIRKEMSFFYTERDRMTSEELEAFSRAAATYFYGSFDGNQGTHFSHLRNEMPGLTHTRFRESYRNRFAYFIRKISEHLGVLRDNDG